MAPTYTISIVCYNNLALTKKCVASIFAHSAGENFELIVTDNDSTDGTREYLATLARANPHKITIITNKDNLGFQDPNNHALTLAKGIYFVMVNNDMEVCRDWLKLLAFPFTQNPKLAITGFKNTCCAINDKMEGVPSNTPEYIEASLLMIPTAIARRHGLFSHYLQFAYWEDTDLSFRLRELGYEILPIDLPVHHHHRGSTTSIVSDARKFLQSNQEIMERKWGFYFKRRDFKRRILIRRLGARGDVLLITPIIRALKVKWPQCEIQVKTKCPEMLAGHPEAKMATNATKYFDHFYDLDLAYEKRPEVPIVHAFADAAGVSLPRQWHLEVYATAKDESWAFRVSRNQPIALIHGGFTCWPGKNWPVERMNEVVRSLRKQGFFTIAVGDSESPKCGCDDSIAGLATPQQFYALAKLAKLFVGIDSMPQHVASAANCPSVVLFGPTNPAAIVRPTHRIITVQASTAEAACVGEHGRRTKAVTQAPCDGACMKAISVKMVESAIDRVLRLTK